MSGAVQEVARLYQQRWAPSAIADRLGITVASVYCYASLARKANIAVARNHGSPPGRIDKLEMVRLHREGWSRADLARRYAVTPNAVAKMLRVMAASGARVGTMGKPRK